MTQMDVPKAAQRTTGIDPRWAAYVVLAVLAVGIMLFSAAMIFETQGRFVRLFRDFGMELMPVTQMSLSPLLPMLLFALASITLGKEFLPWMRRFAVLWNALVLLFGFGVLGFYVVGIFAPLMQLIRMLQ